MVFGKSLVSMNKSSLSSFEMAAVTHKEEAPAESGAMGRRLGGWRGASCTVVAAGLACFASSGLYGSLVLYLTRVWQESNVAAANDLTNLAGTLFFSAVIGGFLCDAYWGRLRTVFVFQVMTAMGFVLIGIAATIKKNSDADHPSSGLKAFLFIALYLTSVGAGSYEPGIGSLGGDQFNTPREKATFFNWYFVVCNLGQLPALTFLTYFENRGKWALGFWISGGAVVLSIPVFMAGAPFCRQNIPAGNPLLRVLQVLVSAARKMKVKPETDPKLLYEVPGQYSVIPGCLKIQHRNKLRWLDRAATIVENDASDLTSVRPWHLCTITQVEELKSWISIIPVFCISVIIGGVFAQSRTLFVEQGAVMDGTLGSTSLKIPPGSMQIVAILVTLVFAPMYDYLIVPLCIKWTKNPKGITSLQRMGWGFLCAIIGMIVAAMLEKRRLDEFRHGATLSILWLVPQYAIMGVSAVLFTVGQVDFFYSEISQSVRSLGMCLTSVSQGLGSFVSTFLLSIVTSVSSHHGRYLGWIPKKNLNFGHLDYFYWLLTSLTFITFLTYLIYASQYTYIEQKELIDFEDHIQSKVSPTNMEAM